MSAQRPKNLFATWCATRRLHNLTPSEKTTTDTSAWSASDGERELFLKLYPHALTATRGAVEVAIAGAGLHPAIVPLRESVPCAEGLLLVYPRVAGENLAPMDVRARFAALPLAERVAAVRAVAGALGAVCDAGFMPVDWYEGNMIYDFEARRIWLFDWELCRAGGGSLAIADCGVGIAD